MKLMVQLDMARRLILYNSIHAMAGLRRALRLERLAGDLARVSSLVVAPSGDFFFVVHLGRDFRYFSQDSHSTFFFDPTSGPAMSMSSEEGQSKPARSTE